MILIIGDKPYMHVFFDQKEQNRLSSTSTDIEFSNFYNKCLDCAANSPLRPKDHISQFDEPEGNCSALNYRLSETLKTEAFLETDFPAVNMPIALNLGNNALRRRRNRV